MEKNHSEKLVLCTGSIINRNSYAQLCRYFPMLDPKVITSDLNVFTRSICKLYDLWNGIPTRNKSITYHEFRVELMLRLPHEPSVVHVLFGDDHCGFLSRIKDRPRNGLRLVFTVHQPFQNWRAENVQTLAALDGLITLCESDRKLFAEQLPGLPVVSIAHGVDVDYWKVRPLPQAPKKRIGYCGKHLRNIEMFMRVAKRALKERDDVEFYCLIPPGGMSAEWEAFCQQPNVRILNNLSQDQVLDFYQNLYLLMMPLNDTTANNVIVESLSCGVPVLTTNVGGIATYGAGEVFPMVENNDDEALYKELARLLDHPDQCQAMGVACRDFAEKQLAWPKIAAMHEQFYYEGCAGKH